MFCPRRSRVNQEILESKEVQDSREPEDLRYVPELLRLRSTEGLENKK